MRTGPDLGLVAVFDGMGGAGGTVYDTAEGPRSGAYLASRLACDVVERLMLDALEPQWHLDGARTARELRDAVRDALMDRLQELDAPATKLRSKLIRALPTTMALVALQRSDPNGARWDAHIMWAGDSRAYVLEPDAGARQLTTDDLRDPGDAMVNLRQDSVVANAMSADTPFTVNYRRVTLEAPFIVVAATDGCFGYVPSPMHFEHMLLATLRGAGDVEEWSSAIQRRVTEITGDDAAMATFGVGADLDGFKRLFAPRTDELEKTYTRPLDHLDAQVTAAEESLQQAITERNTRRDELWSAYQFEYERYIGSEDRSDGTEP